MGRPILPTYLREDMDAYVASLAAMGRRRGAHRRTTPHPPPDPSWHRSMRHKLRHSRPAPRPPAADPRTIFRVPAHIRRDNPPAYEPAVVSIGPLHRSLTARLPVTDEHKWRCVRHLHARYGFGHRDAMHRLFARSLAEMSFLEAAARRCYSETEDSVASASPHQLAEILLLDGCFILYVLLKQSKEIMDSESMAIDLDDHFDFQMPDVETNFEYEEEEEGSGEEEEDVLVEVNEEEVRIEGNIWIWTLVQYDLLKLENQIPFFVVQSLYNLFFDQPRVKLVALARRLFADIHPSTAFRPVAAPSHQVHHLLHLFHLSLLPPSLAATSLPSASGVPNAMLPEWIPSATELCDAGVRFERSERPGSFLEVKFERGVMEVPALHVYKYSDAVFRNLIAFEQCLPVQPYITVYALFMHCVARTAADVRLLQLSGILLNGQSTDGEVARWFNRLCAGVHYANDTNYLSGIFLEVRRYHESRWHKWRAALVRNYLGSPWIILSLVAAALLLLLTVEQAFFTTYAYFKPPNN